MHYLDMGRVDVIIRHQELQAQDPAVFDEIFFKNCYAVMPGDFDGVVVVDVGANIGCFSILSKAMGAKMVLSVEPNAKNYARLVENTKNSPDIMPLNLAVGGGRGRVNIYGEGTAATSFATKPGEDGHVDVATLSDLLERVTVEFGDMALKCDCEGAEYDFLISASSEDIRRFRSIFIEIHKVLNEPKDQLLCYLDFMGYDIVFRDPVCHWKRDGQGNIIETKATETEVMRLNRRP